MSDALRVLFVEDQRELRELIGAALRDLGIETHIADDGQAALRMLREQGAYDVVFSDVSMPNGMSGIELSLHVAESFPQARVILASGYARSQLPPLPPHVEFLPKPYRLTQLLALLRAGAAQRAPAERR